MNERIELTHTHICAYTVLDHCVCWEPDRLGRTERTNSLAVEVKIDVFVLITVAGGLFIASSSQTTKGGPHDSRLDVHH